MTLNALTALRPHPAAGPALATPAIAGDTEGPTFAQLLGEADSRRTAPPAAPGGAEPAPDAAAPADLGPIADIGARPAPDDATITLLPGRPEEDRPEAAAPADAAVVLAGLAAMVAPAPVAAPAVAPTTLSPRVGVAAEPGGQTGLAGRHLGAASAAEPGAGPRSATEVAGPPAGSAAMPATAPVTAPVTASVSAPVTAPVTASVTATGPAPTAAPRGRVGPGGARSGVDAGLSDQAGGGIQSPGVVAPSPAVAVGQAAAAAAPEADRTRLNDRLAPKTAAPGPERLQAFARVRGESASRAGLDDAGVSVKVAGDLPSPATETRQSAKVDPLPLAAAGFAAALPGTAAAGNPTPAEARLPAPPGTPGFAAELGSQLTTFVRDGVQHARLELHPLELGPVTVQIALDGTEARVHLAAEHAGTRQALEQALPTLAGSLREAGFTLSGGGVFEQPAQAQADGGRSGSGQPGRGSGSGAAPPSTGDTETPASVAVPRRRGVVDLVA